MKTHLPLVDSGGHNSYFGVKRCVGFLTWLGLCYRCVPADVNVHMEKVALLVLVVCAAAAGVMSQQSCGKMCSCEGVDDEDSRVLTKLEGLAATVGVLAPLVVGGGAIGLYHLLKPAAAGLEPSVSAPPRPTLNKHSPMSSRVSSPVSVFSEDDETTFDPSDNDTWKSPRPDTSSTYTNIHRASKADSINRWM